MRAGLVFLSAVTALWLAAPADAARVPTRTEVAALDALLHPTVAKECRRAFKRTRPVPLVTDDGTWGFVEVFCQFGKQPSGAGSAVWTLWARRSTATSADWTTADLRQDSRVPPCHGHDGLLNHVPLAVVRELRAECHLLGSGNLPDPELYLDVFGNARHQFDELGPWINLQAASGQHAGLINIERPARPPTIAALARDLGPPRRRGCRAHWPRFSLRATACGRARVTKLTLHAPWLLLPDSEDFAHLSAPAVRVGDSLALAHYLDPRLRGLRANQRFVLTRLRIGTTPVAVALLTRRAQITAIEIHLRRHAELASAIAAS